MFNILRKLEGSWIPYLALGLFDGETEGEGGQPSGGEGGAGSAPVEGEGEPGTRAAGGTGEREGWVPKSRFDQVNNALRRFKELGLDPDVIKEMRDRITAMEQAGESPLTEKEAMRIERELMRVPAFARVFRAMEAFVQNDETSKANYVEYGNKQSDKFLTSIGWEVNEDTRTILTHALAGIIQSNEELMRRFRGRDTSVFEDAFTIYKTKTKLGLTRKVPGLTEQKQKVGAGTRPPTGTPAKPEKKSPPASEDFTERDILDDANERAFELLAQGGEE